MSEHRNNVANAVSGTPGTGTITLASAVSGSQSFSTAYGANATVDVFITDGTAWEVARNCTYTHSGTTLTRGTLEASSTGSAISLTSAAVVRVAASADSGRRWDAASLEHSTVTGTSGAISAAVNTLYVADMSGWTADRTLTLPATAAVGDRVGVMASVGDDTYELIITASSGDTINGIAGGTEWSRLFITGEVVILRCVAADSAWVVEQDGRIQAAYSVWLSTSATAETAATWCNPTSFSGAWSVISNVGESGSNSKFTARRAGRYAIGLRGRCNTQMAAEGKYFGVAAFESNLTTYQVYAIQNAPGTAIYAAPSSNALTVLAVGGESNFRYVTQDGSVGLAGFASAAYTAFSVIEVLT